MKELTDFDVEGLDGKIGELKDLLFDDQAWAVRFLVVKSDEWLAGRNVLVSPIAIGESDTDSRTLRAAVTREQVRLSPDVDTEKPVSRQHEVENYGYYGYPFYWGGTGLWGNCARPAAMLAMLGGEASEELTEGQQRFVVAQAAFHRQRGDDPHLRSCRTVGGYHIEAKDGRLGHVEGFVVDDETWAVRYLIVDTSDWWLGHQVLIAPEWIVDVNWLEATVLLEPTRQAVKDAPPYDGHTMPDEDHERALHAHHASVRNSA
jgi:hypothetical protein